MISGQANIEMAVRATRLGAVDFLEKPLSTDKLLLTVDNVLKLKRLEDENRELRQRVGKHEIVHSGERMRRVMAQVDRVAASEARVCILGETGTGKELIARALHERSPRQRRTVRHAELRGGAGRADRERAVRAREGQRSPARRRGTSGSSSRRNHGTLFLDEIGDMPMVMQAKLLRVLEEGQVERVGGDRTIPVDVRVVVATHRNLDELVKKGVFREDLYHRIYVFPLFAAAAARARRRDSGAGGALRGAGLRAERLEAQGVPAGGDPGVAALFVAGQCARAAQCGGAAAAAGGWARWTRPLVRLALPAGDGEVQPRWRRCSRGRWRSARTLSSGSRFWRS